MYNSQLIIILENQNALVWGTVSLIFGQTQLGLFWNTLLAVP
jgi:hypothetical protein